MRGLQTQLAVLRQNIRTAQKSLDLVQARFDRGITNELDVTLARRQLATLQAQLAPLAAQISAAQYAIAVLLGQFPEDLAKELAKPELIPQVPDQIDAGLPLDLIRRRPDIREAERQLAGATARIGVATANLFPRLALTAGARVSRTGARRYSDRRISSSGRRAPRPSGRCSTSAPWMPWSTSRTCARTSCLVSYKQTVLRAVQEVDGAISSYAAQQDRLRNLGEALGGESACSQPRVATLRSRADGFSQCRRRRTAAVRPARAIRRRQTVVAEQFVALYKGLGGGWEQYQSIPPIRQPQPAIVAAFRRLINPTDPQR